MPVTIKNKTEKIRFGTIGVINTSLDIGILFALTSLGLPALLGNVISTSTTFSFSFFANKAYTFKTAGGTTTRQVMLFVAITLFGLWVLQSAVIWAITSLLHATTPLEDGIILLAAKLLAVVVSLVWNYTLYSRVVFKKGKA